MRPALQEYWSSLQLLKNVNTSPTPSRGKLSQSIFNHNQNLENNNRRGAMKFTWCGAICFNYHVPVEVHPALNDYKLLNRSLLGGPDGECCRWNCWNENELTVRCCPPFIPSSGLTGSDREKEWRETLASAGDREERSWPHDVASFVWYFASSESFNSHLNLVLDVAFVFPYTVKLNMTLKIFQTFSEVGAWLYEWLMVCLECLIPYSTKPCDAICRIQPCDINVIKNVNGLTVGVFLWCLSS